MAGTLTVTTQNPTRGPARPVEKFTLSWTSTSGGAVSGNAFGPVSGELLRVVFLPGTGGAQPTNGYTATLKLANGDANDDGIDLLAGQASSLSNSTKTTVTPSVAMQDGTTTSTNRIAVDDMLDLVIAGAGNAKSGVVVLYVR
jgi:hypothetical protein